jgi:hypothetical protein
MGEKWPRNFAESGDFHVTFAFFYTITIITTANAAAAAAATTTTTTPRIARLGSYL